MRGFTQTLVNTLFGWIRVLVEGIWDLLFSNETQQWLTWVADNWMTLVVFLCFCGVALDYLIWFLRWRPHYVWASSLRRLRRLFGGGRAREDKQASREPAGRQPMPVPTKRQALEAAPYETGNVSDIAWEEQGIDELSAWEQPGPAYSKTPAVTADTIMARPRKSDYQDQYVRRFARPEPEPQATSVWQEEPQESITKPQQEYFSEPEAAWEEENWAPEQTAPSPDQPIHPGIDYQALSRQYGWHRETQNPDTQPFEEEEPGEAEQPKEQPQDQNGPAWNFSGLENFSPYRAPAPPAELKQRVERTRKTRTDSTPMSLVKSGLSRIAKHAGKVLTVDDEEANKILDGLPPPIDKRRAFHAPVYPNRPGADTKKSPDFREDD